MSWGINKKRWMALSVLLMTYLCPLLSTAYHGCPDFMDIEAPHVDLFTGKLDEPFDSIGRVEERHRLNEVQGFDPNTGGKLKFIPDGELKSIRLGNDNIGGESESIVYHYIVDSDNSLLFVNFAVVLEDPGHEFVFQPRFVIRVTDKNGKLVNDCSEYDVSAAAGLAGFQDYESSHGMVRWRDWSKIGLDLTPFVGQEVQVQFITYDCFMLGHFGYAYFTASCAPNKLSVESCTGSTFTLSAPEGFPSYRWDNGDTTRSTTRTLHNGEMSIFCEVTSVTGCQFTQSAYIADHSEVIGGLVKDTICQGEPYRKNYFDLPPQMNVGTFGYNNVVVNPSTCTASSEINLELTILQTFYPVVASICEGEDYFENGFHVVQPPVGVFTDTLRYQHQNGRCDSVVCLRLEVSETNHLSNELRGEIYPCVNTMSTYYIETEDNLSKYTWTLPENVKVVSGEHSPQIVLYFTDDTPATLMLTGENGCGTSAVPIKIYPKPSYHFVINDTICQGDSYSRGEIKLGKQNQPGIFTSTYSYTTSLGCDSTVVLSLHVLPVPEMALEVFPDNSIFCDSAEVRISVNSFGSQPILHTCEPAGVLVGDVYCKDGSFVKIDSFASSGKIADGVVYFVDDSIGVAYVLALDELTERLPWSREYVDISGIENQMYLRNLLADMDGYGHTTLMRKQGDSLLYPSAWKANVEEGWYIPAVGELRKMFGAVTIVNHTLEQLGALPLAMYGGNTIDGFMYASSSEYDASRICVFTSDFMLYAQSKSYRFYKYRFTKSIQLSEWMKPQYKIGDLVENSDGSKGIVCYLAPDGKSGTMVSMSEIDDVAWADSSVISLLSQSDIKELTNSYSSLTEWSGYENTAKCRELGDASLFPAAWAVDFEHGWYVPSVAQMNYLYVNSILLDSMLVNHGGDILTYDDCWTSSFRSVVQKIPYAWYFGMGQGNMEISKSYLLGSVRPMRDFTFCEEYVEYIDSSCTYRWNTMDTLSSILVYPHHSSKYQVEVGVHQGRCKVDLEKELYVQTDEPIILDRTICHGQRYKDEYFEESESGTYTTIFENGECQQTVVLHLNVLSATDTLMLRDVACQGAHYQKHGFNITPYSVGIVYDTVALSDQNGCDSVLCLLLEVLPAQRDTQYARVCQNESYRENGFDIPAYQSTVLKYWERSEVAMDGCMVIHVLGLYVDTVYQISMVDSICFMERYQKNGFDFLADEEGYSFHYLTHTSSTQCDSIIALRIKTLGNHSHTYYDTILYNESYRDENFILPQMRVSGDHSFDTVYVDQNGCDSLVTLHLFVRNDDDVNIPTAFTPMDGNGVNDLFMEGYEIYIYDRYGLLVCHSQDGWDGTYRGEPADAGVYIYTIRFKNGKERHGTIEIIKE